MSLLSNHRKHPRLLLHQSARCVVLRGDFLDASPRFDLKAIISNLSFGGMRLLFIGRVFDEEARSLLKSNQHLLLVELCLPSSLATLQVTCRVKWFAKKFYVNNEMWVLGLDFVTKTQELYREIDRFFKSTNPSSEWVQERRFFPRVPENVRLRFSGSNMKRWFFFPKHFEGNLQNLSAMGMLVHVVLKKDIDILRIDNTHLKIDFRLSDFLHIEAEARTVYVKPICSDNDASPGYITIIKPQALIKLQALLGIQFLHLSEKNQDAILEYVAAKCAVQKEEKKSDHKEALLQ